MKDGHTEKLELKADDTKDIDTSGVERFNDFTDMNNRVISGNVHIGIGGTAATTDGDHPATSSVKLNGR